MKNQEKSNPTDISSWAKNHFLIAKDTRSDHPKLRIGVFGFYLPTFDKDKAVVEIDKVFGEVENHRQLLSGKVTLVLCPFDSGVFSLAYAKASALKWDIKAVCCLDEHAREEARLPIPNMLLIEGARGSEDSCFVEEIDVLIRIGGGHQADNIESLALKKKPPYSRLMCLAQPLDTRTCSTRSQG